jgi:hypothetical protein
MFRLCLRYLHGICCHNIFLALTYVGFGQYLTPSKSPGLGEKALLRMDGITSSCVHFIYYVQKNKETNLFRLPQIK